MGTDAKFAELGQRLKSAREAKGISRSELAEVTGLSYPYISQLETGLRRPSRSATWNLEKGLALPAGSIESFVPADAEDAMSMRIASSGSRYSGELPGISPAVQASAPPVQHTRESLIGDMVDLIEEFDMDERLGVLAELQQRAMARMLEQQQRGTR